MATKTANHVAAVQIFGALEGQESMNDFYYLFDHQPDHSDLVALAAAVSGSVIEAWVPHLPGSWLGRSVFAFDMTVESGANAVDDSIAGVVGTAAGTALPNNATFAVARKNGLRGRSGNGRIFWQGLSDGQRLDTNHLESVAVDFLVAACEAADAAAADAGGQPVILSFQHDGVVSDAAVVFPLVTWAATDNVIDSRRRRLPGRGS